MRLTVRRDRFLLAGCLIAAAAAYLPTLDNYLVADSWVFMMPHSFFEVFGYFVRTMLPPETNALWLRPIPMFTYWLDTVLWPGTTWGPHFLNVLFHLVNVWLIFLLARFAASGDTKSGQSSGTAPAILAACLIYGLHPLAVGAVGWIAARFDVMAVTFGLAGMYLWLKRETAGETINAGITVWASVLLVLGLLSKEQGIVYIAASIGASVFNAFLSPARRSRSMRGTALLVLLSAVYLVYRIAVFRGLGGYLEARNGLSVMTPLYYLLAIVYPYGNVIQGAHLSVSFFLAALAIVISAWAALKHDIDKSAVIPPVFIAAAVLVTVAGLATNAPNAGLAIDRVMGHAESRFALNAIAGIALCAGAFSAWIAQGKRGHLVAVAAVTLWGITGAWRTDAQIQAWDDAAHTARTIVEDTRRLAPDPATGSSILYFDIPRTNSQWAYIYGIGLREAVQLAYRRTDFEVIRYPKREDLRTARPGIDHVFVYDEATGHLNELHARRRDDGDETQNEDGTR